MNDHAIQTDEQLHDKLNQMNNKLKHALQTIKDKIHRLVIEQPELFANIHEDTSERLDHLIVTVGKQMMRINTLKNDYDQSQIEINQLRR